MEEGMEDTWGFDPQVRYMRRIFSRMESAHKDLLEAAGLSSYDSGVSRFRGMALLLFEKIWPQAVRKGIGHDEEGAASLYAQCLAHVLTTEGITLPSERFATDKAIAAFLNEVL
jgi:hypothetical protein